MLKFEKSLKVGTKVKVAGIDGWIEIESITEDRLHCKLKGYAGSWQRGHIITFTNK